MGFAELSSVLWRERYTLELLLFKLEAEQLLLTAGRVTGANRELPTVGQQTAREAVLAVSGLGGSADPCRIPTVLPPVRLVGELM
jgi:hypothetical protein